MSHTDLGQPDLAALRAAAGDAESAEAEARLVSACGYPFADVGPLAHDLARSLTEAGFTLHHCATYDPLYRLDGVFPGKGTCCRRSCCIHRRRRMALDAIVTR
jgi:hypothetical protein